MRLPHIALLMLMTVGGAMSHLAHAAETLPANEQVIVLEVDRRKLKKPRIPSSDLEFGAFVGTYSTQNFGSSSVTGVRLGYHITEDFFVEGVLGRTEVTDASFRQVLPAGIFADETETLSYYNLSLGYNVLPGEVFLGASRAKPSAIYLIAGVGNTRFTAQNRQTVNLGFGARVFLSDWAALQLDARDHMFSMDLLGKRQNTQNLEVSVGLTFFF